MGSTIETLQDNVSGITDDQTDNAGGKNNSGGNKNGGNNAQNGNGGGNNRSNIGNFNGSTRRRGAFYYMTTARVTKTKVHDVNHFPNPTKPDTMERTESDSHADTTCAGKNMTLYPYTSYEYNVNGFHYELKSTEKIPVATVVMVYDEPLLVTTVMLVFNKALWFGISM